MKNPTLYSPGHRFYAQLTGLADCYSDLLDELDDLRSATDSLYEELSPVLEAIYDSLAFYDDHQALAFETSELPFADHAPGQGTFPARKGG